MENRNFSRRRLLSASGLSLGGLALAGLFAWFDAQNGSRAAAAEVAGSAAFALVPAALATLAGWSAGPALALAGLALTRSVPTVLTVRNSLRLSKGEPAAFLLPLLTAAGAAVGRDREARCLGLEHLAQLAAVAQGDA